MLAMKRQFCDFGILVTACLIVLTVAVTAPVDSEVTINLPVETVLASILTDR